MLHSEKLRKTHRIVGFDMEVEVSMKRGDLSRPKANITVFWEVKNDINIIHHESLLEELTKQMANYDYTLEHIA